MNRNGVKPQWVEAPVLEQIVTNVDESFLWRLDNYPWERNVWNYHPEIELHLIVKSRGVAFVGDHIGEFYPGYLVMVGGGLPHDWVTAVAPGEVIEGRDIILQFHPDRLVGLAGHLPEFSALDELLQRSKRGIVFTGDKAVEAAAIMHDMANCQGFTRLVSFLNVLDVLSKAESFTVLSSLDFRPNLNQQDLDSLQVSMKYIVENFAAEINLGDVATLVGMKESAFSRFFKKNAGNTFTEYLTAIRLHEACRLLAGMEHSVTDICFMVGYSNMSNFNRRFMERFQTTPSSYRKMSRERRLFETRRKSELEQRG